jgi:hypothetical protein
VRVRLDEAAVLRAGATAGASVATAGGHAASGTTMLRLRFSAAARQRLRRRPSVRLIVTVTARDAAGNIGRARCSVTLRR